MAETPIDLYRSGNANSPRMDNVRSQDVATYEDNGQAWVMVTLTGGISVPLSNFQQFFPTLGVAKVEIPPPKEALTQT